MQPTPPPEPRPAAATSSGAGAGPKAVRSAPIKAQEAAVAAAREKLALEEKLVRIEQGHRDRQLAQVAAWQEETKAQTVRAPWLVCPWRTAQRCARDSPAACVDVRCAVLRAWCLGCRATPVPTLGDFQGSADLIRCQIVRCAALRCAAAAHCLPRVLTRARCGSRCQMQERHIQKPSQQAADPVVVEARQQARETLGIDATYEEAEKMHRAGWPARRIRPVTAPAAKSRASHAGRWETRMKARAPAASASASASAPSGRSLSPKWKKAVSTVAVPKDPVGLPGFTWREVECVYGKRVPAPVLGRNERAQTARPAAAPKAAWWGAAPGGVPRPHTAQASGRSMRAGAQSPRGVTSVQPPSWKAAPDSVVAPLVIQPQRRPFSAAPVMMGGGRHRAASPALTPRGFVAARAESRASTIRSKADRERLAVMLKEDGNDAFRAGDNAKAVRLYTEGLEEDPASHALYSNRSAAQRNLGNLDDALRDANRCIDMDPKFANGHVRKGQALEAQLKWRQAAEAYRTGLDFAPDNKTLQFGLKTAQAEDGKKVRWTGASGSVKHPTEPEPEPEPEPPAGDGCRTIGIMTGENVGSSITAKLTAMFNRADRNKDGLLTRAELIHTLRKDGELAEQLGLPTNIRDKHRDKFEELFQQLDVDGSSSIILEEFLGHFIGAIEAAKVSAAATAKLAAEMADEQVLQAMFNEIDSDGNGTLDRYEVDRMAKILGMDFNQAQMDMAWKFMDHDGSGEVEFDEFKHWHDVLTGKKTKDLQLTDGVVGGRNSPPSGKKSPTSFLKDEADDGSRTKTTTSAAARALGSKSDSLIERMQELGALGSAPGNSDCYDGKPLSFFLPFSWLAFACIPGWFPLVHIMYQYGVQTPPRCTYPALASCAFANGDTQQPWCVCTMRSIVR
eukprot:COSAG06_NODE_4037_length_4638_cov_4.665124_3_plen_905_part_00